MYLFTKAQRLTNIKLPIHLRYQSPGPNNFKSIPVYEPLLYTSCSNEFYERKTEETYQFPCPNSSDIHNVYDLPKANSCTWFDVDFILVSKTMNLLIIYINVSTLYLQDNKAPSTISVPVGNQSLGIPVFIVTLLVAWAAAAYLIHAVLKQKQRISKKVS